MDKKQRVKKALCVFLSVASVSSMVTPVSFADPTGLWLESTLYKNEAAVTTGRFENLNAVAVYIAKTKKDPTIAVYLRFDDKKYTRLLLFDAPAKQVVPKEAVDDMCKNEIEEFKTAGYGEHEVSCPTEPVPAAGDGKLLLVNVVFKKTATSDAGRSSAAAAAGSSPRRARPGACVTVAKQRERRGWAVGCSGAVRLRPAHFHS
ncbi:hypothetical protein FACS1894198_5620 [Clostridia bacterium]|nr:hypothetical protein FACS1894198_5620 [Clostridia bacterium]